ncbi:nucleoside/nucleotide kinase family protein [Williamsia sterculiae]|uniref:Uridine kinase n=1 Tax=Williamsia sterculiae TaxID=1344003 RepID=A0A1N7EGG0_9NOCA|nr:hypothetical protein [Williamsia sterculiae]SIR87243.1 hypothetical protein SAMN05445060_1294 [Williamsia sterculiae]
MPDFRPSSPDDLVVAVADLAARGTGRIVVAIDGADAATPDVLGDRAAAVLRATGRPAEVVALRDFIRPASVRMEWGHTDPESFRTAWFDYAALDREVLGALRDHGRWLPRLWDEVTDRSPRDRPRVAADDQVVFVCGPMLLGRGLRFDATVGLQMSRAALLRTTPDDAAWTVDPLLDHHPGAIPDLLVRYDHPDRPAVAAQR